MSIKYIITQLNDRIFTATFESDKCVELKPVTSNQIVGNIYIGRVENVVKNINSAFIEIKKGVKCYYSLSDNKRHLFLNRKNNANVNQGDSLLVQVINDAIKTKPATVSDKITLTGKYVVLSTDIDGVNISKKTQNDGHCKELKSTLEKHFNFNVLAGKDNIAENQYYLGKYGFILRTNSAEANTELVVSEAERLVTQFADIINSAIYGKALTCLYEAPPAYIEEMLDLRTSELEAIITDKEDILNKLMCVAPDDIKDRIRLYNDALLPLKSLYSLERELEHALNKRVWLKCGGYLVIEQTEALSVVDVNTGKFVTAKGSEDAKSATLLKVNMEAADELARQIRLRNLTGIIIVDFINMKSDEHINQLLAHLKECIKQDSQKCTVVDITKLGLVEMTRQKGGKSLRELMDNQALE